MPPPIKSIGVVGAGNMGSMMTLRFAELGLEVSVWDIEKKNVDEVVHYARDDKSITGRVEGFYDINKFAKSLEGKSDRKLFMFSITHGEPADEVLRMLKPDLKEGDIILDGGNENYRNTERRQKECAAIGVAWIGMGVSGGYQSARRGPSLSPGGDAKAIERVMPFLESYAAHDPKSGTPCVKRMGPGGSGHYIKMVHNGIEGGMLSVLAETWQYMHEGLAMEHGKIGDIFAKWNESGELRGNYLINIGADMLRTKRTPKGDRKGEGASRDDGYVLDDVLDKVVQDDDNTEGTPLWCLMEASASCEEARDAHAETDRGTRDHAVIIENLRQAVYCSFLASFCQGLELISRASIDEGWNVNLGDCLQIWRAGCIIKSEHIADLLQPPLAAHNEVTNTKFVDAVAHELRQNFHSLKQVVMEGTMFDQYIPALSATLEYLKYEGGLALPTKFMEAQLDYFGAHNYNKPGIPGEDPGPVYKGPHHYEWLPA
ncbi:6-phosphogluconate dehydrogenase C-terminal [Penicillium expansum]|nr:6-phosphogluconate dehydrogenase C-terminal [Penicillium expansum]